jgi:hypothetical protein
MNSNSRNIFFIVGTLFITLTSCKSNTYLLTNHDYKTGVDFTQGKWLLNTINSTKENRDKLTQETTLFFTENIGNRYYFRADVNSLLLPENIPLNPNKEQIKSLQVGTGFDYFINVSSKKNKDELGTVSLFDDEQSTEENNAEVTLEIYDLNLHQIIYTQEAIGSDRAEKQKSIWETKKSNKLIDNINFHRSSNKLVLGSLKKILKDLKKKSIPKK